MSDLSIEAIKSSSQSIGIASRQQQMWAMLEEQWAQDAMSNENKTNQTYQQEQQDLYSSTGDESSSKSIQSF